MTKTFYLVSITWWATERLLALAFNNPPTKGDLELAVLKGWRKLKEDDQCFEFPLILQNVPDHPWIGQITSLYGRITCEERQIFMNDGGTGEVQTVEISDNLIGGYR